MNWLWLALVYLYFEIGIKREQHTEGVIPTRACSICSIEIWSSWPLSTSCQRLLSKVSEKLSPTSLATLQNTKLILRSSFSLFGEASSPPPVCPISFSSSSRHEGNRVLISPLISRPYTFPELQNVWSVSIWKKNWHIVCLVFCSLLLLTARIRPRREFLSTLDTISGCFCNEKKPQIWVWCEPSGDETCSWTDPLA